MNISLDDPQSLKVFEALASPVRIKILQILAEGSLSQQELASALNLSNAIVTMHIRKLLEADLILTTPVGKRKVASLNPTQQQLIIDLPQASTTKLKKIVNEIPIGLYSDFDVTPTCGLAAKDGFIGTVDEPKFFMDTKRMTAGLLWFTQGYVEYQTPNYLKNGDFLAKLELSLELSSEYPGARSDWPSDITFYLNGHEIGTWTSPGDFGDSRGRYNPSWYPDNFNQYGLLKTFSIEENGTFVDGEKISNTSIKDFSPSTELWHLKIEVKKTAKHIGGCTLFGESFGNYNQNIRLVSYYRN